MKNLLFLFLFSFLGFSAFGQYGVRLGYNINNFDQWEKLEKQYDVDYHPNQIEVGINYWLRLKTKRVEFLPEVTYGFPIETILTTRGSEYSDNFSYLDLKVNTQFYLFDFAEDCNCPTFSKQGSAIIKGLFVYVSPGLRYNMHSITTNYPNETIANRNLSFLLSAGAGYDIGITDLFTVTPYVGISMTINDSNEYSLSTHLDAIEDTWNAYTMGARFTMRFDYINVPSWKRK